MAFTMKDLLEFSSIKTYLDGSIGSKKQKIDGNLTLEQKIKTVNLSQVLRGVVVYFEYSKLFGNPSEIIAYYKENRDNDDKIAIMVKEINDFPNWVVSERKLSEKTAIYYSSHIRGFLTHNNIRLKFKNFNAKTEKKKTQNRLGITYEELKRFAEKVKEYINDFDLRLLIEFEHRTGLAFREVADLTFGLLRAKDYENNEYVLISDDREKSTIEYTNFISPDLKPYVLDYLKKHSDQPDEARIFSHLHPDPKRAYHLLDQKFNTAYLKCIKNHFPRYLKVKTAKGNMKKVFSLHSFRAVFKTACDIVRIIPEHRDMFIAHKSDKMTNYDLKSNALLEDYKIVEKELFGKKTQDNATIDQVFDILKELVSNKGKRMAIHKKYVEDQTRSLNTEIKAVLMLEQFKLQIKQDIKREIKTELKKEFSEIRQELKQFKAFSEYLQKVKSVV